MSNVVNELQDLKKALEAGNYNAAPGTLTQGAALQKENLDNVMKTLCFDESHIHLQKKLQVQDCKSMMIQYVRQLGYGSFGSTAQYQGGIGRDQTLQANRGLAHMCFYSTVTRNSIAAQMVETFDGVKADERSAISAARLVAGDIEFDSFRGQDGFSNGGVFDGNPMAISDTPNMKGIFCQVRESDSLQSTRDLMFAEFGSDQSVVLPVNGALSQSIMEDASLRSALGQGTAEDFMSDPVSLSAYNKIAHGKERIVLAGSPQAATGANLREQWTANGGVVLSSSHFLRGKFKPAVAGAGTPAAPAIALAHAGADGILAPGAYIYYVTAVNENGEGAPCAPQSVSVAAGEHASVTITAVSGAKYYNVYRSVVGGSVATAMFIGKIAQFVGNPVFIDLGNKLPGSVTACLLQKNTMSFYQLAAFTRMKMPMSDLSEASVHYRFLTLSVFEPRKNVILDNIKGTIY